MKRLLTLCLVLQPYLALPMAHAQQTPPQSTTPDTPYPPPGALPAGHWAYEDVKTLQDARIVIGYPVDGTYSGRPPMLTRAQFATAIARLLPLLVPPGEAKSPVDLAPWCQELQIKLQENQPALDALMRLVDEFGPELTALGQDVPAVQARLTDLSLHAISPPFPDVPKNHWAYQSVETLRKLGVVRGEADGKFHG